MKKELIDSIDRLGKGGLEVLNLVIPKPRIPADIANNYKQVKQVGIQTVEDWTLENRYSFLSGTNKF